MPSWLPFTRQSVFSRRNIADQWLAGDGLEIGALMNPLRVPRAARVSYVDRLSLADLRKMYPTLANKRLVSPSIVDDGEKLTTVADESQNFVIANHVIEHIEDPTATLKTFFRVLKPGGVVYLAIPDKRFTFDAPREETSVAHLLRDYREGPTWSRRAHFEEYIRCVENIPNPAAHAERVEFMLRTNGDIHYHCWSQAGMWAWLNALQAELRFPFVIEFYLQRSNEGIFILRKTASAAALPATASAKRAA